MEVYNKMVIASVQCFCALLLLEPVVGSFLMSIVAVVLRVIVLAAVAILVLDHRSSSTLI